MRERGGRSVREEREEREKGREKEWFVHLIIYLFLCFLFLNEIIAPKHNMTWGILIK